MRMMLWVMVVEMVKYRLVGLMQVQTVARKRSGRSMRLIEVQMIVKAVQKIRHDVRHLQWSEGYASCICGEL